MVALCLKNVYFFNSSKVLIYNFIFMSRNIEHLFIIFLHDCTTLLLFIFHNYKTAFKILSHFLCKYTAISNFDKRLKI